MNIDNINPFTGEVIEKFQLFTNKEINTRIDNSYKAFLSWKKTSFKDRCDLMFKIADLLENSKESFAALMATEMGKPVKQGKAEVEKCAKLCRHYAEHAKDYLAARNIETNFKKTTVYYEPIGSVFAIMPWNFPFWQVFRFAVPTIMAGNVALLKHAPITTGSGLAIEQLFLEAGFPENVFQCLILDNDTAADVIANNKIAAVTLTGSERAGKAVAKVAAEHVKKVVLELGGSDPYVVLEDADLDLAAKSIVSSRMNNTGQVCISAKRAIIVKEVYEEMLERIIDAMKSYVPGDPLKPDTNMGPLAREDLRENLQKQVMKSCREGAKLLIGGEIPKGQGFCYPPTILTNVEPGMTAFDEELFGPALAVIKAKDENDAIKLANMSKFGLGGAVFTKDIVKGEKIARYAIEAGSVFVNAVVSSDPRVPFGGVKHSGFGRELSKEGILEFINIKTVSVNE